MLPPLPSAASTISLTGSLLPVLEAFPGPLGTGSSKEKVCSWQLGDQLVTCRPCACGPCHASLQCSSQHLPPHALLWHLLLLQVAKFCTEQAEAAAASADSRSSLGRGTLWSVLRVLALHQGKISSAPYSAPAAGGKQADPGSSPECQLAAALLGSGHPSSGSQAHVLLPTAAPSADAAAAAAQVQQLLLAGRRADALR